VRIDYRWAAGDPGRFHKYADELLALAPDVVLGAATPSVVALRQATRAVPIIFVGVGDPVAAGFVDSLARPGGNSTGFTPYEYGISAKWLELLKEIAPGVTRAAVIRETTVSGIGQFAAMQGVAPALRVELSPIDPREPGEIERAVTAFARKPNSGLIVTGSPLTGLHRNLIFTLAAQHRLPAVYPYRYYVMGGGLISYGADLIDEYRRAAGYVDRILKGDRPADLPVQAPTKFELAINLKTAKALGLDVPSTLLARADAVIE
jgi:putative ABC transport system substrate-binding protein